MDYLDPKKKKQKRARIMFGYGLLGIAMAIATVLLVYVTNGYYVDSSTGEVIQNGLIYVDSKPESAKILLDGVEQGNRTDARLVVPGGMHTIQLQRDGYRPWLRTVSLEGGSLRRLNYARLIPTTLDAVSVQALPILPTMVSESIDKRWLVMGFTDNRLQMQVIDIQSSQFTPQELPLPVGLIKTTLGGTWNVLEWADDNKTFLATYTSTDGAVEYVLINRDKPAESVNVADVIGDVDYDSVSLRDRKKDLLFAYNSIGQTLSKVSVGGTNSEAIASGVIKYTSFGEDVLYVSNDAEDPEKVMVTLRLGEVEFPIRTLTKSDTYLLDMSKIGNAHVIGISSTIENRVIIYDDPIDALTNNGFSKLPVATTVLRIDNPTELSISADSSVISARGGQSVVTHEFEEDRSFSFDLTAVADPSQELRWLDGRHFTIGSAGKQYMIDYDGSNQYELVAGLTTIGSYFGKDLDVMFTFSAGSDEATPAQMVRTSLRTPADR
jgi:hypothetical protein